MSLALEIRREKAIGANEYPGAVKGNGVRYLSYLRLLRIHVAIVISTLAVIILSCFVSANPVGPQSPPDTTFRLTDPVSGVLWLFLVNLLVNLACYCGVLLTFTKKYIGAYDLVRTTGIRFLGALVCVVMIITIVGAFVDFYLVAQPRYIDNIYNAAGENISGTYRVFVFDALAWALALALIVASVVLASMLILQMSFKPSVAVAVIIAALNLIAWLLVGVLGEDIVFLSIMLSVLVAPVLVSFLVRWYAERVPERGPLQAV